MFISSVQTCLPGPNITNEELCEFVNFRPQLINKLFGNIGRHLSVDITNGKPRNNTSDLMVSVLEKLKDKNGQTLNDIEFIVTSTASPDFLLPTSINEACHKLGLKDIETYQIVGGCSGAVQAMNLAKYILASGMYGKGIVLGVECINKFLNIFDPDVRSNAKEMVNYVLFGDGAGGCIVENQQRAGAVRVNEVFYRYIGLNEPIGQLADWRGSRGELCRKPMIQEEYKLIEKIVPELTVDAYDSFLSTYRGDKHKLWFMPPQLSGKMVQLLCQKVGVPMERTFSVVSKISNCANAALFFQLEQFFNHARAGEEGFAISIESSRWLTSRMYVTKNGS